MRVKGTGTKNPTELIIVILTFIIVDSMSQSAESISQLPKDTLIEMAIKKIDEPSFNLKAFDRIEVWLEGEELTVDFGHAIQFIPKKGQFYYGATVDLVTGNSTLHISGNGRFSDKVKFYKPVDFEKKINFVIDAINNSNGEVGEIPKGKLPTGRMTIQEEGSHYDITVDSRSTHSYYKIKKISGKIYDAGHKHYDRSDENPRKRIY